VTELMLVGKLESCERAGAPANSSRRLHGDGEGRFRTRGRFAALTVTGTTWTLEDRCDGTLTRVRRGKAKVRDLVKDETVTLSAGERYVARPRD
jgi:hypothetical protein